MTMTFTLIDDTYSANESSGRKSIYGTISCTNPYTAGGDVISGLTYFKSKFLGGFRGAVNASVSAANAGVAATATFRGDLASTTSFVVQLWNAGLSATANAGLFVDNTVANISGTTFQVLAQGY